MCRESFVLLAAAMLIGGCGDPLAGGDYRGRALLTLQGPIEMPQGAGFLVTAECDAEFFTCFDRTCPELDDDEQEACWPCEDAFDVCVVEKQRAAGPLDAFHFQLGIFWARSEAAGSAPAVQQFTLVASSFPARYDLTLYTPPPDAVLQAGSEYGQYALGLVLVYLDSDEDGRWTRARDQIVGGSEFRAVLYSPDGVEDDALGTYGPGYHTLSLSPSCEEGDDTAFGHYAEADDSQMTLQLSVDPAFLGNLVLDPDCDGIFDEFEACPDPEELERYCDGDEADHALCELCFEASVEAQ